MQIKYQIVKGQQYDAGGATVTHGSLCTYFTCDGDRDCGDLIPADHMAAVAEAVCRVIVSGVAEEIVLGQPTPVRYSEREYRARCERMAEWERTDI